MVSLLLEFIKKHALFSTEESVLLAVSGGMDSMVMLHLFEEAGFNCAIAHCDFQLRGEASTGDRLFVEKWAQDHGIEFYHQIFDTTGYASEKGISIEMAARDLRYEWFESIRKAKNFDLIATAHHQNDLVETILFNLVKGTGLAGFHGIIPRRGYLVRPMLFATRSMLEEYAQQKKISWREDASNQSLVPHRNKIRTQVIPVLKAINPSLEKTIARSAFKIQEVEKVVEFRLNEIRDRLSFTMGPDFYIKISALKSTESPHFYLAALIQSFGFNEYQVQDILESIDGAPGKIFLSQTHRMNLDREQIIISPEEGVGEELLIKKKDTLLNFKNYLFSFSIFDSSDYKIDSSQNRGAFDLEKLQFPLLIRNWQPGDSFYPLGMRHKKKVSDFMIDSKIPVNLKKRVLVIESHGEIIWLMGLRIDNRFKITAETNRVYEIKFAANDQSI